MNREPSLASATGTHLDTACRHMQQCKVYTDLMVQLVADPKELENKKYNFCVHKDEAVVGVSRPWDKSQVLKKPNNAYPRIIGNLGDPTYKETVVVQKMIKAMYHFATSLASMQQIINIFNDDTNAREIFRQDGPKRSHGTDSGKAVYYFDEHESTKQNMDKMHHFYTVGVANTVGWAHPNTGDTACSIMIGGLRTVRNGDWLVEAGDLVQWYWTFERDCFDEQGCRKKIFAGQYHDPEYELDGGPDLGNLKKITLDVKRRYMDKQYGSDQGKANQKANSVIRFKRFIKDEDYPRMFDAERVIGRAISSSRANDLLDIKICMQSL